MESTPGLLRLITWVLTGLDVKVQTAQIRTDELTGIGQYTFYVLNAWGEKVRKQQCHRSLLVHSLFVPSSSLFDFMLPRSPAYRVVLCKQSCLRSK